VENEAYILHLESVVTSQSKQIDLLVLAHSDALAKIEELRLEISLLKNLPKKDSHNSSLPPSSDTVPLTKKNLRVGSGKRSGGQKGHKGNSLEMSATPDHITELKPSTCSACGHSLDGGLFYQSSRRQVVDIPPIKPIYTEFQQYACECPHCSHKEKGTYPSNVNAPIQYGSSVSSLISYLSVYQYIPYQRLALLFEQVFHLPLSQGTIEVMLNRTAEKCEPFYEDIKVALSQSEVVGADETGAKINGKKGWFWTWQNNENTYIVASANRGDATVEKTWENGLPNATLVSDRWAAQLGTNAKNHQICLAHLLRDAIYLIEAEKHAFATQFKDFLVKIFDFHKTGQAYKIDDAEAKSMEQALDTMLCLEIDTKTCPKTATFQKSMRKNRLYLLPCIYDNAIPPDNNGSERAVRNIKVKQKVSGQFKTGEATFAVIRSVIDTLRKRKVDFFSFLEDLFKVPVKQTAQAP
jgi:transposase